MKTFKCIFSIAMINKYARDLQIARLKAHEQGLYFQYNKDRRYGSFYLVVKIDGKTHWILLGHYPFMSVAQAKKSLVIAQRRLLNQQEAGHFQGVEFDEHTPTGLLLQWALTRGLASRQLKAASKRNLKTNILGQLLPRVGEIELGKLSRRSLDEYLLQPLLQQYQVSTVLGIFQHLKWCFAQGIAGGVIVNNPVSGLRFSEYVHQRIVPRQSRLTVVQLPMVFNQLTKATAQNRLLGLLLLLFGTRIGETGHARWSAFDFKAKLWRIPAADTKTGQAHSLALSSQAILILQHHRLALSHRMKRSDYLFPKKSNLNQSQTPQAGSQKIGKLAQGQWSAHDVRKLCRTTWTEQGVDHLIGELLLNHQPSQLDKAYIQTLAQTQCRAALNQWHRYLEDNGLVAFLSARSTQDKRFNTG